MYVTNDPRVKLIITVYAVGRDEMRRMLDDEFQRRMKDREAPTTLLT